MTGEAPVPPPARSSMNSRSWVLPSQLSASPPPPDRRFCRTVSYCAQGGKPVRLCRLHQKSLADCDYASSAITGPARAIRDPCFLSGRPTGPGSRGPQRHSAPLRAGDDAGRIQRPRQQGTGQVRPVQRPQGLFSTKLGQSAKQLWSKIGRGVRETVMEVRPVAIFAARTPISS